MKIGIFVQHRMSELFDNNKVDVMEVERLLRPEYCKRAFNINYPVLKEYDRTKPMADQRNVNGYARYYADLYAIREQYYLLCNDWYED